MAKRLSTTEAAEQKGCSRQALNLAIRSGKLDAERIGKVNVVVANRKYADWTPNPNMQKGGKARAKKAKRKR
jgi:hypothetical protein